MILDISYIWKRRMGIVGPSFHLVASRPSSGSGEHLVVGIGQSHWNFRRVEFVDRSRNQAISGLLLPPLSGGNTIHTFSTPTQDEIS